MNTNTPNAAIVNYVAERIATLVANGYSVEEYRSHLHSKSARSPRVAAKMLAAVDIVEARA